MNFLLFDRKNSVCLSWKKLFENVRKTYKKIYAKQKFFANIDNNNELHQVPESPLY